MRSIAECTGLPVGYSDHTSGGAVAIAAVALGATTIEKHFTLDRNLPGPDHKASLEPNELARMIADIRNVERALGDGIKRPRPAELPVRALVRRSLATRENLPAGHLLREQDITFLRPASGLSPAEFERVIGQPLKRAVRAAQVLTLDDVEPKKVSDGPACA
jgi:sialic acid synthase SpsE